MELVGGGRGGQGRRGLTLAVDGGDFGVVDLGRGGVSGWVFWEAEGVGRWKGSRERGDGREMRRKERR